MLMNREVPETLGKLKSCFSTIKLDLITISRRYYLFIPNAINISDNKAETIFLKIYS